MAFKLSVTDKSKALCVSLYGRVKISLVVFAKADITIIIAHTKAEVCFSFHFLFLVRRVCTDCGCSTHFLAAFMCTSEFNICKWAFGGSTLTAGSLLLVTNQRRRQKMAIKQQKTYMETTKIAMKVHNCLGLVRFSVFERSWTWKFRVLSRNF